MRRENMCRNKNSAPAINLILQFPGRNIQPLGAQIDIPHMPAHPAAEILHSRKVRQKGQDMALFSPRLADFNFRSQHDGRSLVSNSAAIGFAHLAGGKQCADIRQHSRCMAVDDADQLHPLALCRFFGDSGEGKAAAAADFDSLSCRSPPDMHMQVTIKALKLRP
ncbi:hypothetical protein D3C75_965420 [compost metagenome]